MQNNFEKNIYCADSGKYGTTIFSAKKINKGETVFIICGPIIKQPSIYTVPIDFNLYIDPIAPGKFLNHSCEPSCGIKNRTEIVAMRDLGKDEEITIDYAMIVYKYDDLKLKQKIVCNCGSKICRGKFGSFETLPENLREKYKGFISDYMIQ
ncbi:MAG: SET domain-containing protein-lysine N-methyltransferase [Patescibacteria group bacterium]|nr:SET domain-containing protein-lysine N-methyltransferase [Patescibacteria group bacterium]